MHVITPDIVQLAGQVSFSNHQQRIWIRCLKKKKKGYSPVVKNFMPRLDRGCINFYSWVNATPRAIFFSDRNTETASVQ